MNNFQKLMGEMTMERFIDMMLLNCGECPVRHECDYATTSVYATECVKILEQWCEREVTE